MYLNKMHYICVYIYEIYINKMLLRDIKGNKYMEKYTLVMEQIKQETFKILPKLILCVMQFP